MELNSLFTIDDLRNVESFLREVDSLDEAIIIKDNRPMYRVIRIGSPCDRWVEEKRNTRGNLWKAMSEFLETCENQTAHAKDIAYAVRARPFRPFRFVRGLRQNPNFSSVPREI